MSVFADAVMGRVGILKSAGIRIRRTVASLKTGCTRFIRGRTFLALALLSVSLMVRTSYSTQTDDLTNAIDTLGSEVNASTTSDAIAERLLNETNATETALLIAPVVDAQVGAPVDVPLTLIPGPSGNTAIQFSISLPEGLSIISVTAGPAANAVVKSVTFSTNTSTALLFGLNQRAMVEGVVAIAHLQVSLSAKPGLYSFEMNTPVASDAAGKVSLLSLTSGTLRVK